MVFGKNFQSRLYLNRRLAGLSQRELAATLGLSSTAITELEGGRRLPNYKTLIALADYFGVSLDYLVGRSDDPKVW